MKILTSLSIIVIMMSGCAGGWTDKDKEELRASCMKQAQVQLPNDKAVTYCDCFVEQIVRTFPVFNDMVQNAQSDTVDQLKAHCRREIGLP